MNDKTRHSIEYHSQDQRKHYRLTTPFWVQVEGKTYKTKDWSVGGLLIPKYHKQISQGQVLDLKIMIKFQGFNIGFESQGKAVGIDAQNNLRIVFENLSARSKNILQFFSQSIISGEMVDIEDTIKRVDIPINMQEENLDAAKGKKPPLGRWPAKSIFYTALYLTLGLIIFSYITLVIYSNFVHMKVESAVVSAPVESVVSPFSGIIGEYYVKKGTIVKKGQPLVKLVDHDLSHSLELEKTALTAAKNNHNLKSKFLDGEKNKIAIYQAIGNTKYDEAQSNVHEFTERLEQLEKDHIRATKLYEKRHLSKADMDKFEADYETVKHQLDQAKHQLNVHEKSLKAIETGHYFSDDKLEGEIPQHQANLDHAANQIEVIQGRISALEKQIEIRTIKSAFSGHIVNIFKSDNNTVSLGDDLLLLERDQTRVITAFLTQDEVVEVTMNSTASVYIPSIKKTYTATVTHIDRTDGFIDEVNSQYRPRTMNDRSAMVTLALENFTMEDARRELHPGTPSVVYFDRSMLDAVSHRLSLYFTPADRPGSNSEIEQSTTVPNKTRNIDDI